MSTSSVNTAKLLLLRGGLVLLLATVATLVASRSAMATTLPTGFVETTEFSGLSNPTVITFAPNGRVFVAEKSGLIKGYDNLNDNTPTTVADLSNEVYNFWDRGLLGLAVDPQWPSDPYLYALYTRDALPGGEPQEWGSPGVLSDPCPSPPGPTGDGCVVSGRLSRLTISSGGSGVMSAQTPLITDWCQQYPSHSIGDLAFGPDGALYVSGGDGAAWHITDYGQDGDPVNPCGDPPGGAPGTVLTPPTAEGGSLRSQDVRTSSDPTGLDGSILRLNPDTGAGMPDNPNAGSPDPNARRIVAYGFRNPFRFTIRPGTDEVWIGEVGKGTWEEINRLADPNDATADNFGWPCYEGVPRQGGFNGADLDLCEDLYDLGTGAVVPPYFTYRHDEAVVDETCPFGSSSLAGIDFYESGPFPGNYDGALFFADYSRDCVWVMRPGPGGAPDPSQVEPFAEGAANPVDIEVGPGGDLFYADFNGTIKRVTYTGPNTPPTAVAGATPSSGEAPLEVELDASESTDPDGDSPLTFAWDLDEDGQFDDSTEVTLEHTFNDPGTYEPAVRVTDPGGASGTDTVSISVDNTPPVAQIDSPTAADDWAVDEIIAFSGSATDDQETLPGSAFHWELVIDHCPSNCHQHDIQEFDGVTEGSFAAPDHDYPSALILALTVTDSGGLSDTASVRIDPRTANLTLASNPAGVGLALGDNPTPAPFTRTVIEGSNNTVIAPTEDVVDGETLEFVSWSDGGDPTHNVKVDQDQTLTATYLDVTAPGRPQIAATDPGSPANRNDPAVIGQVGSGSPSLVKLYANSSCAGVPAATGLPSDFSGAGIRVAVPPNEITGLTARATDATGNDSACSEPFSYTEDSNSPQTTIVRGARDGLVVPLRKHAAKSGRLAKLKFSFVASEPASFQCRLDVSQPRRSSRGGGWYEAKGAHCVVKKRRPGLYTLRVRAIDLAENVDATPAVRHFRIVKPDQG